MLKGTKRSELHLPCDLVWKLSSHTMSQLEICPLFYASAEGRRMSNRDVDRNRAVNREGKNKPVIITLKLSCLHLLKHHYLCSHWGSSRFISFILPASLESDKPSPAHLCVQMQPASSHFAVLQSAATAGALCPFPPASLYPDGFSPHELSPGTRSPRRLEEMQGGGREKRWEKTL